MRSALFLILVLACPIGMCLPMLLARMRGGETHCDPGRSRRADAAPAALKEVNDA